MKGLVVVAIGLTALAIGTRDGLAGQRQGTVSPAEMFVTVNGLRIHYVDWGNPTARPLILIHGLDRVSRTFDHLAPHFTARYHVIAMDMRGHGDSGWDPEARYLVEDHVGDVEGLVQQLGLKNITIWGNSTGGRVAQVFAGKHPDLVSAVISEDVGPERQAVGHVGPEVARDLAAHDARVERVARDRHAPDREDDCDGERHAGDDENDRSAHPRILRSTGAAHACERIVRKLRQRPRATT